LTFSRKDIAMLWWLAETTLMSAGLAGAVALLCRRLRPRPAVQHALWLVVLVRLLMPPLVAWPWPAPTAERIAQPAPPEPVTEGPPEDPAPWVVVEDAAAGWPPAPSSGDGADQAEAPTAAPVTEAVPRGLPWEGVVLGLWLGGAMVMALLQLIRVERFRARTGHGEPAPAELLSDVATLAAQLGVRVPAVVVVPGLASPVIWGFGRARLLWPAVLLGRLSPDGRRAAIVHELAHVRRRDHWVGWLQLFASCAWWWSPVFWLVRRQLGRAAELACDACVVEVLPRARRAYAEALLEVCELVTRQAAPAPALGMGGTRQEIERRLTMILRESVPSRVPVRALFGVVLLGLIALPGFTDGQDAPRVNGVAEKPVPADNEAVLRDVFVGQLADPRPAVDEREQRLQRLETSLEALLKEVKQLRGATGNQPAATHQPKAGAPKAPVHSNETPAQYGQEYKRWSQSVSQEAHKPVQGAGQPIHLCRVSYTLPRDKAEALGALLKDLKAPVLETAVKADGIVVTTTPEGQRIVGDFVALLQGRMPSAAGQSPYYPASSGWAPVAK
jgi:beta-lactamase regulating signal transducer with metallopeptidase domain